MHAIWCIGLMLNVRLRQVGRCPESHPISNQIAGVIMVESHHLRHHKRAQMMYPRVLRKWDDEECLVEKKKNFLLSCFYISFCYVVYGDEPCGRRSTALNRWGAWLSVGWRHDRHQRVAEFFVIIIVLHMSCVLWHDIIPSFDKAHSTSHSFKDNHTLF